MPLWKRFTLSFNSRASTTATPLGSTTALPPYRQFFGGGPDSVRGFRESRLGPKDQFGNPYGGNLQVISQNELILPDAGEVARQRPRQPVLRHRQRVLDQQQAHLLRSRTA